MSTDERTSEEAQEVIDDMSTEAKYIMAECIMKAMMWERLTDRLGLSHATAPQDVIEYIVSMTKQGRLDVSRH